MKSGFSNPIAPKEDKSGKEPWSFKAPEYDNRSGNAVSAGCQYGVGYKQPVGHEGAAKQRVACLPFGFVNTMRVDEAK